MGYWLGIRMRNVFVHLLALAFLSVCLVDVQSVAIAYLTSSWRTRVRQRLKRRRILMRICICLGLQLCLLHALVLSAGIIDVGARNDYNVSVSWPTCSLDCVLAYLADWLVSLLPAQLQQLLSTLLCLVRSNILLCTLLFSWIKFMCIHVCVYVCLDVYLLLL